MSGKIDYAAVAAAGGIPKVRPKGLVRHEKGVAKDAALAAAYRKVEIREDNRCRVTGVELLASCRSDKLRREHHHLVGRNVKPEWRHKAERIILVSAYVHGFLESSALLAHGTDARKPITFSWNKNLVQPGKAPFRLRPEVRKTS